MRILLISYFFPPDKTPGGHRALSFVKYFPKNGIDVVLLTSKKEIEENKDLQKKYELTKFYIKEKPKLREWGYKTKILSALTILKLDHLLFFPDIHFPWIRKALRAGKKAIKETNPSKILVTAPPFSAFIVGFKLSKKFKIPLIIDYRDPWNGSPYIKYPLKIIERRYRKKEQDIVKQAEMIVTVGEEYAKLISNNINKNINEITIIYNGFFKDSLPKKTVSKESQKFTISYVGCLYELRRNTFINFLKGFELFIKKNNLNSTMVEINYAGVLTRKFLEKILEKTHVNEFLVDLGFINDINEYYTLLRKSHVLPIMIPSKGEYAIPSKLYEYFNANSHILFIGKEGAPVQLSKKIKQEYDIVNEQPEAISKILEELYNKWKNNNLEYGCDQELLLEYSRENQAIKLANILQKFEK